MCAGRVEPTCDRLRPVARVRAFEWSAEYIVRRDDSMYASTHITGPRVPRVLDAVILTSIFAGIMVLRWRAASHTLVWWVLTGIVVRTGVYVHHGSRRGWVFASRQSSTPRCAGIPAGVLIRAVGVSGAPSADRAEHAVAGSAHTLRCSPHAACGRRKCPALERTKPSRLASQSRPLAIRVISFAPILLVWGRIDVGLAQARVLDLNSRSKRIQLE